MAIKLITVKQEYYLEDAGGYKFFIEAAKDEEFGWQATITLSSWGMSTPESALRKLREAAERFICLHDADEKDLPK